jgi:chromosome segregation ATPase
VQAYQLQQRLAQLQLDAEATSARISTLEAQQQDFTAANSEASALLRKERDRLKALGDLIDSNLAERDALAQDVRAVKEYNDQTSGDIAVSKRAAHKTEQAAVDLEKQQAAVQEQMASFESRNKRAEERNAFLQAQVLAQSAEAAAADEILAEASAEMDALAAAQKQQLSHQTAALHRLGLKNQEQSAKTAALALVEDRVVTSTANVRSLREELAAQQDKTVAVEADVTRLAAETEVSRKAAGDIQGELDREQALLASLLASCESADSSVVSAELDRKKLRVGLEAVERKIVAVAASRRQLDDARLSAASELTTVRKSEDTAVATLKRLQRERDDLLSELVRVQNELAKLNLDAVNSTALLASLQEAKAERERELGELDATAAQYQAQITRNHAEIAKRTAEVDQLNKALHRLEVRAIAAGRSEAEAAGPLDATLYNLTRQLAGIREECSQLQAAWLRSQEHAAKAREELDARDEELALVLEQSEAQCARRDALEAEENRLRKALAKAKTETEQHHRELVRLNGLVADRSLRQAAVEDASQVLQADFALLLREAAADMAGREAKIRAARQDREDVLAEIVAAEERIQLLQRKVLVERETQAALDPQHGQSEVKQMRKEIHRMELRLQKLLKSQKDLSVRLDQTARRSMTIAKKAYDQQQRQSAQEREVARRAAAKGRPGLPAKLPSIGANGRPTTASTRGSTGPSQREVRASVIDLQRRIRESEAQVIDAQDTVDAAADKRAQTEAEIAELAAVCQNLRAKDQELLAILGELDARLATAQDEIQRGRDMLAGYASLQRDAGSSGLDAEAERKEVARLLAARDKLLDFLGRLTASRASDREQQAKLSHVSSSLQQRLMIVADGGDSLI